MRKRGRVSEKVGIAYEEALKEYEEAQKDSKRAKEAFGVVADEYTCPITLTLPTDPVTAEDGHHYERKAIEEWIVKSKSDNGIVKSPFTNQPMGTRLFPATQLRNTLTHLIQCGAITGDKASAWKRAMEEEAELEACIKKAEKGDVTSMSVVGFSYRDGKRGAKKDLVKGFKWLKMAADHDSPEGTTACGIAYLNGNGVETNLPKAIHMITVGATLGSEHACALLALGYSCRHDPIGFGMDNCEAMKWAEKMKKCPTKDSVDTYRNAVIEWVDHMKTRHNKEGDSAGDYRNEIAIALQRVRE